MSPVRIPLQSSPQAISRGHFSSSPLITPERIFADPDAAFAVLPSWVRNFALVYPEGHERDISKPSPVVIIALGKKHIAAKTYSPASFAALCELTRLPGISITTNHNGSGRHYERITIADHPEDLTSVNRFLLGAAEYTQVKVTGIQSDMRPENLMQDVAEKASKDARQVVLSHVKRILKEWEASGNMPSLFIPADYLENVERLLQLTDLEATGVSGGATR
ncbi:MAG: hypothetical protein M9924_13725 [Rhizobiaceae bacterium]|nr:hypothetical protein [Rhizobiaceae bacterium]